VNEIKSFLWYSTVFHSLCQVWSVSITPGVVIAGFFIRAGIVVDLLPEVVAMLREARVTPPQTDVLF
jgi:hypothetical protein